MKKRSRRATPVEIVNVVRRPERVLVEIVNVAAKPETVHARIRYAKRKSR